MNNRLSWILLGCIASICTFLVFEYLCFSLGVANKGLFRSVIEERNLEEKLDIPSEQLGQVSDLMIDYVKSWRGNVPLQVTVTIDGDKQNFYSDGEMKHIEDVRILLCKIKVVIISLSGIVGFLISLCLYKKKYIELCYGCLISILVFFMTILLIGIVAVVDINLFVALFHKLLFDNNDWIMNPARERIVYFFPNYLYQEALRRMLICTAVFLGSITLFSLQFIRKEKQKRT